MIILVSGAREDAYHAPSHVERITIPEDVRRRVELFGHLYKIYIDDPEVFVFSRGTAVYVVTEGDL